MKFPGMDWNVEAPEDHGLDAGRLADAAKAVGEIERRYGFLVIKSGAVVHETYYEGDAASKYHTFSITKGFGATLVGIALTQGCLTAKDLIWDWLPSPPPGYKGRRDLGTCHGDDGGRRSGKPRLSIYMRTDPQQPPRHIVASDRKIARAILR